MTKSDTFSSFYPVTSTLSLDLIAAVGARSDEIERGRRLPADLVGAMAEAGLFRMAVPRAYGGGEAHPAELLATIEDFARADGSAGWCVMIGATTGLLAAYLPEEAATEIYGRDENVVTGGVFAPKGFAQPVEGGYRVSGRWPFASGSEHCAWLCGGCTVEGSPSPRMLFFPAADVEIIDTWTVSGLAGTGSHDMAVTDVFVPSGREVGLGVDHPRIRSEIYTFPVFGLLALGIAAVGLGIARAAVDELLALAGGKTPTGSSRTIAERAVVQASVAEAEASLRAARALLYSAVGSGGTSTDDRVGLRLAASYAVKTSARVVDTMYDAGGGSSVYATSPLQKYFRDIHVVTQHAMVAPATWELTGRILLGLPTQTTLL